MPIYEYRCEQCRHQFDQLQQLSAPQIAICPQCSSDAKRLISAPMGLVFRGSGWYITDYAKKGREKTAGNGAEEKPDQQPDRKPEPVASGQPATPSQTKSTGDKGGVPKSETSSPTPSPTQATASTSTAGASQSSSK